MFRKTAFAAIVAAGWLMSGAVSFADETVKAQEEFDFVQAATSGSYKDGILTLNGIGKTMILFGERPNRDVVR